MVYIRSAEKQTILQLDRLVDKYDIKIHQVVDAGAFDLTESLDLARIYDAKVLAFECNPYAIKLCKKKKNATITFIDKCINLYNGDCTFYPTNLKTITTHANGNPGASSLYIANGEYPTEKYEQDEINVKCCRIDTVLKKHKIKKVDLLWMDLQGAELIALKSMGKYLWNVDVIVAELEIKPMYHEQCLFGDVDAYLNNKFFLAHGNTKVEWFDNFIYINKKYDRENKDN